MIYSLTSVLFFLFISFTMVSASVHVSVDVSVDAPVASHRGRLDTSDCHVESSSFHHTQKPFDPLLLDFPESDCDKFALFHSFHHHFSHEFPIQNDDSFSHFLRRASKIHQHNVDHLVTKEGPYSFHMSIHPNGHESDEQFWGSKGLPHDVKGEYKQWKDSLPEHNDDDEREGGEADSSLDSAAVTDGVDWRARGKVNPPKDQAQCGSCWAFGTVSALESLYAIKTGNLIRLSEQNIIDCDTNKLISWVMSGCKGYTSGSAMSYVRDNGICLESVYPYVDSNAGEGSFFSGSVGVHDCKPCASQMRIDDYNGISSNEAAMVAALNRSPVTVTIHADDAFMNYGGGILDASCNGGFLGLTKSNGHVVSIVGYTSQYWIVRNSWGSSWGEGGYARFRRGKNQCGINDGVVQPVWNSRRK